MNICAHCGAVALRDHECDPLIIATHELAERWMPLAGEFWRSQGPR